MRQNLLTPEEIDTVTIIFDSKGWSKEDMVFENFTNLLSKYNSTQKTLLLDLTKRFTKIQLGGYEKYFFDAINKINKEFLKSRVRIYFCPLAYIKNEETPQSKSCGISGIATWKCIYPSIIKRDKFLHTLSIQGNEKIILPKDLNDNDLVIFIDDFIGSGEQATRTINYNLAINSKLTNNNSCIITLAILNVGFNKLKEQNIIVYPGIILNKGISDYYTGEELKEKTDLMIDIEETIKPKEIYKFGRNKSEALISLSGTPNNTFPIYWLGNKKKDIPIIFPRY